MDCDSNFSNFQATHRQNTIVYYHYEIDGVHTALKAALEAQCTSSVFIRVGHESKFFFKFTLDSNAMLL